MIERTENLKKLLFTDLSDLIPISQVIGIKGNIFLITFLRLNGFSEILEDLIFNLLNFVDLEQTQNKEPNFDLIIALILSETGNIFESTFQSFSQQFQLKLDISSFGEEFLDMVESLAPSEENSLNHLYINLILKSFLFRVERLSKGNPPKYQKYFFFL